MTENPSPAERRPSSRLLDPFSRPAASVLFGLLVVGLLVLFRLFPQIDLAVTGLFHDAALCVGAVERCVPFPVQGHPWLKVLREGLQALPVAIAVALAGTVVWRLVRGKPLRDRFNAGALAAIGALILAAGLLVNGILKSSWGRPRPLQTDLFGGDHPFVVAGDITAYCTANCSFVSGESAAAFWMVGAAALVPPARRELAIQVALTVAAFTAMLRVSFGAHYLSDVSIAAALSLFVFSLVALVTQRATKL